MIYPTCERPPGARNTGKCCVSSGGKVDPEKSEVLTKTTFEKREIGELENKKLRTSCLVFARFLAQSGVENVAKSPTHLKAGRDGYVSLCSAI